jgi:hypothetical protein
MKGTRGPLGVPLYDLKIVPLSIVFMMTTRSMLLLGLGVFGTLGTYRCELAGPEWKSSNGVTTE